jgi:hypothetical protein
MRKPQGSGRRPIDRIVLRAGHTGDVRAGARQGRRPDVPAASQKLVRTAAGGATMDYQMGFTSGPSN